MPTIYLASGSPRRKELLTQLVWDNFKIIKSNYEEDNTLDMSPIDLALHHSLEKWKDVIKNLEEGIVISADTFVSFDNKVLWKPKTQEKAKEYLKKLSGKNIEVLTWYAVIDAKNKQKVQGCEVTKVKIGNLNDSIINSYVETWEPLDKAWAFGIQWKWAVIVEKMDGCYFNVVGLPLYRINQAFDKLWISVFDFWK